MLQPVGVLREAGVNGWRLCVQNSRYSDTLLESKTDWAANLAGTGYRHCNLPTAAESPGPPI
jgi:hypothetical protein